MNTQHSSYAPAPSRLDANNPALDDPFELYCEAFDLDPTEDASWNQFQEDIERIRREGDDEPQYDSDSFYH